MKSLLILSMILIFSNCEINEIVRQQNKVDELWEELVRLSESESCTNSGEWRAAPIGNKACGGPAGYLPYSVNIDTTYFLDLARQHREASSELNRLTGAFSTCDVVPLPDKIECKDGKAELIYN